MYKFRTMVVNADELKEKLAHLNDLQWPDFKIAHDPRITRVGSILRNSSLDELPQLINVLIGDMSLLALAQDLLRPKRINFGKQNASMSYRASLEFGRFMVVVVLNSMRGFAWILLILNEDACGLISISWCEPS